MAARPTLVTSAPNSPGADTAGRPTPGPESLQGQGARGGRSTKPPDARGGESRDPEGRDQGRAARRMPRETMVILRGVFILGQLVILLVTWRVLKWPFAPVPCLGLIGVSIAVNASLALSPVAKPGARPAEVTAQLAFDIVQLTALLFLTGGVANPFAMMLIFPLFVAGNTLPVRHVLGLFATAVTAALVLAVATPPWVSASTGTEYRSYGLSRLVALFVGLSFATAYAVWSSTRSARRELALDITESVLAREQRLSALGALSAVVAHELGTPLATITIIATEMAREAPAGPLRDDANLMVEQAKRCREILKRLAEKPERQDALHERMSLLQFVREIVEPYAKATDVRVEAVVTGAQGVGSPDLWRRPEVLHAISTMVENAFDFARGEILLTARFDADWVAVEVRDDGPGFAEGILAKLGDPYVTSRPGAEGSRTGHVGMGLGVFIAKTLLERSGARVAFANGPRRGAIVTARWPRSRIEAPAAKI